MIFDSCPAHDGKCPCLTLKMNIAVLVSEPGRESMV